MKGLLLKRKDDINNIVRSKRIQLGLTQEDLADACSLAKAEYRDIEDYNDELYMVVPLSTVDCICDILKVPLEELYGFLPHGTLLPRGIVDKKLKEKNLSVLELSDFVGIEESYVGAIIEDIVNLGNWVMDPVVLLAEKLELNLGSVLKSYSKYCKK